MLTAMLLALALALAAVLGLFLLFQLLLALGAPWGRLAWGGQHPGRLPAGYRIASGVAALLYAGMALVALDLASWLDLLPAAAARVLIWVMFAFFALGVLMNAISRSKPERFVMTPVALALAVLALLVALQAPAV